MQKPVVRCCEWIEWPIQLSFEVLALLVHARAFTAGFPAPDHATGQMEPTMLRLYKKNKSS